MKKLLCFLACLVACTGLFLPAFASEAGNAGYRIDSMDVQATLGENNVMHVTETIAVTFLNHPSHGLIRTLPTTVTLNHNTDGGQTQTMRYKAKVTNVSAEGAPLATSEEDGNFLMRLGSEEETVTSARYILSYDYDMGDDRLPDQDLLFYSVCGSEWSGPITSLTFSVAFEKPLNAQTAGQLEVLRTSGGEAGRGELSWQASENGVTGRAQDIAPGDSVTVFANLPADYFTGTRQPTTWPFWVFGGIAAALCLYILVRAVATQQPKAASGFVTSPPQDISAAEVGFIIDGVADTGDLMALVIQFAQEGLLSIEGLSDSDENPRMTLHRLRDLPDNAPAYQRTFWLGLFPGDETVCDLTNVCEARPDFFNSLQKARRQLMEYFTGPRALEYQGSAYGAVLLPLAACLCYGVAAVFSNGFLSDSATLFGFLSALFMALLVFLSAVYANRKLFARPAVHVQYKLWLTILSAAAGGLGFACSLDALIPVWLLLALVCLVLAACLFAPRIVRMTPFGKETTGQLLALRRYIADESSAGPDDVARYNPLLAYAYVFGLSDVWSKRFENLAVPTPVWWNTTASSLNASQPMLTYLLLFHGLERSQQNILHHNPDQTGNGGEAGSNGISGTGSFGSGGFSGGGFGGGGGSSW